MATPPHCQHSLSTPREESLGGSIVKKLAFMTTSLWSWELDPSRYCSFIAAATSERHGARKANRTRRAGWRDSAHS